MDFPVFLGRIDKCQMNAIAKTQKPLLFIDTNIYLDFYRAETKASLSLLKHIESIPEALITTDQVEMEFLNNRQRVISTALQSLKVPSLPPFIPAYLSDSRAASRIEKDLKDITRQITLLKKRFARILKNPASHDPVFKVVKKAMSFASPMNLKFCEAKRERIFERALRRFQRGFPPRKKDDTSVGDAVNWEWIVECAIETGLDVVIVSRDGDFGLRSDGVHYVNDSLQDEFKDRVSPKRKVEFTTSLAQALRDLKVPVTEAEESEEQKIIAQRAPTTNESLKTPWPSGPAPSSRVPLDVIWAQLLERVGKKSPFTRGYLLEAIPQALQDDALTIGYEPECHDYIDLVNNQKTNLVICSSLKEMGFDCGQVRFVRLPIQTDVKLASSPRSSEEDVPF